jgi:hypothetical protein
VSNKKEAGRRKRRRRALRDLQQQRCYLCNRPFGPRRWAWPTFDHVTPQVMGGVWGGNVLLAHARCNEAKADRAPRACELLYLDAINARLSTASA